MTNRPRIDINSNPETLDAFIKQNLRFNLFGYAHVLAEVLIESFWGKSIMGMKKSSVKKELDKIKKIKSSILKHLRNYLAEYPVSSRFIKIRGKRQQEDFVINEYKLKPLIETLNLRAEIIKRYEDLYIETKEGRSLANRNKIASIWALAIKHHDEISWGNIVRLLKWFHKNLEGTKYREVIKTRGNISKERELFKDQCIPIIEKDIKTLVVCLRFFFIKDSNLERKFSLQSIIFTKNSIEINKMFTPYNKIHKTKMEFIKDKKFFSSDLLEPSADEKEPFIKFPNGEIFAQKSSNL